jgi:hypothetical protein
MPQNPHRPLHVLLGELYRILPAAIAMTTTLIPIKITPAIHICKAIIPMPIIALTIPITQSMRRSISFASLSVLPLNTIVHFSIVPPSTMGNGNKLMTKSSPCPNADHPASSSAIELLGAIPYIARLNNSPSTLKIGPHFSWQVRAIN